MTKLLADTIYATEDWIFETSENYEGSGRVPYKYLITLNDSGLRKANTCDISGREVREATIRE